MIPPKELEHLRKREGVVYRVYLDSLDKPTGGVGHLMSEEELEQYPVGAELSEELVEAWLEADAAKAWLAAYNQANGIRTLELQGALFHVNFQLGAGWPLIHKKTWGYIRDHEWQKAAIEAADSRWNDQTPLRVYDFQLALIQQAIKDHA